MFLEPLNHDAGGRLGWRSEHPCKSELFMSHVQHMKLWPRALSFTSPSTVSAPLMWGNTGIPGGCLESHETARTNHSTQFLANRVLRQWREMLRGNVHTSIYTRPALLPPVAVTDIRQIIFKYPNLSSQATYSLDQGFSTLAAH